MISGVRVVAEPASCPLVTNSYFLQQALPQPSHVHVPLQHAQLQPSLRQGHLPEQPHAPLVLPQGQPAPHEADLVQVQDVSSQQPASE